MAVNPDKKHENDYLSRLIQQHVYFVLAQIHGTWTGGFWAESYIVSMSQAPSLVIAGVKGAKRAL